MWKSIIPILLILAACENTPEPAAGSQEPEATEEAAAPADAAPADAMSQAPAQAKFNLNTATEEEFLTIPEVDDRMVHEFFEYRPYLSIEQFRQEIAKYVSEEQVAAYEQYVYVPIDPNESDEATLQQIPGVDAAEAAELVAARPFDSNEAFLDALGAYVAEEERSVAAMYLAQ